MGRTGGKGKKEDQQHVAAVASSFLPHPPITPIILRSTRRALSIMKGDSNEFIGNRTSRVQNPTGIEMNAAT
ncbi:hypothetical protein D3C84_69810 [compost metagenome]